MTPLLRVTGISLLLGVSFGCADGGHPPPSPSLSGNDAGTGARTGSDGPQPNATACEDSATHVYVMTAENRLYRFRPRELTFEDVGQVTCELGVSYPNSMAVDRYGIAWVNYFDGGLYRVSTTDARCGTIPEYQRAQSGFVNYGMAFVKTSDKDETLFVDDAELAVVDTITAKLTPLVRWEGDLAGAKAELTGTGDGRLYGFFTTKPNATFARIDPKTAAISEERTLEGVDTGTAWAFSFWGGDFWFYTSKDDAPSTVTRLHSDTGQLEVVVQDVGGFRIVGAGVSTCAPLTFGPR
jgi:hypothetical protein